MQYVAKLCPRAVMSSGRGSSSAGLTATAVKDGGHWALEAGALVLADGETNMSVCLRQVLLNDVAQNFQFTSEETMMWQQSHSVCPILLQHV